MVSVTPCLDEAADQLREPASSCRRLARRSATKPGSNALLTVASQFESEGIRVEHRSNNASDGDDNSRGRLLAALAWQDALWLRKRPFASRKAIAFSIGELDG